MPFRKARYIIILTLMTICSFSISAQDYYCVSVDSATGVIKVTTHPNDYTQVTFYEVNYSDASGFLSGSFNAFPTGPEDTYPITGTDGRVNRFNVEVIFHPLTTSPYGHPISSIRLIVTTANPGVAKLDWNPVHTSLNGTYYIERYEAPFWHLLDTVQYTSHNISFTYYDTLTAPFCSPTTVHYRIRFDEYPLSTGCSSISNDASGIFSDQGQPEPPVADTVSIYQDPSGTLTSSVILGWSNSLTPDVIGYKIYRSITGTGIFDSIGWVPNGTNQYIDNLANPCFDNQEYYYAIVSTDGCNNGSANIYHAVSPHNILLNVSDIDPCESKVQLDWNSYENMPGGMGGYYIYRQENNGTPIAIDTVVTSVNTYTDSLEFINGNTYTYFVRAFSLTGEGTSTSCLKIKTYHGPVKPDSIYIIQASVINDESVEVEYYYSPADRVRTLLLERSDSPTGPFAAVDTLAATGNTFLPQQYSFTDETANVHSQSYYYRLTMVDSCNRVSKYSTNIARSILLTCTLSGNSTNMLSWNDYSTWEEGVEQYEIYRLVNGSPDPVGPLTSIVAPPFEYSDNLNALQPSAQACYYIKAIENDGNPVASGASSYSNTACALREPVLYMPNAFNPTGLNNRFRPVQAFVQPGSFTMQIYNKWGQMIFETSDLGNGWDGYINGSLAPMDVYMYRISYASFKGDTFEKRGLVTLVQ